MAKDKKTSKEVASEASEILRSRTSTKKQKSVAASALAQAAGRVKAKRTGK